MRQERETGMIHERDMYGARESERVEKHKKKQREKVR